MIDLKFIGIADFNEENERAIFVALRNCNLGDYIFSVSNAKEDNTASSKTIATQYLPPINLNTGEAVVIYSRNGGEPQKTEKPAGWHINVGIPFSIDDAVIISKAEGTIGADIKGHMLVKPSIGEEAIPDIQEAPIEEETD